MAGYKERIQELALKIEAANGTFLAPATDGTESKVLMVGDPTIEWQFDVHERQTASTDQSQFPALIGRTIMQLTFDVEMRRTGTGATADQWMQALQAAAMVKTSPATNAVYKPSSKFSDQVCLSGYAYIGSSGTAGIRVALKGMACNLGGEHAVGQRSLLHVTMFAVYSGFSTAGAVNSVTHETTKPSVFLSPSFTFGGVAVKISRFAWDLGNDVQPREDVNEASGVLHFFVANRAPTWEADPEFEPTGTLDFNALLLAGTESAVAFNIQGSNLTFAAPAAQIKSLRKANRNGLAIAQISGPLNRGSAGGDDEIVITKA